MSCYRFVTGAERKEMREFYAVHSDYSFVALAFDRDTDTVRRHVGNKAKHKSEAIRVRADERARKIIEIYDASPHLCRDAIARKLGFASANSLSVMLSRARSRVAKGQPVVTRYHQKSASIHTSQSEVA